MRCLWRPYLRDSKDDHILELAAAASSRYIITRNIRDFAGSERFGVKATAPAAYLKLIGEV
jgi:hypothetical protein